ncbi:hypothetical protein [Psychrobacter sp. GP33]|uniref:hypothetical protein n=1 Tax=Psychrobacter sp. GP33 TaxID=2758709 RepID=UPI0015FDFF04|nr:hypothetical protein [Psychrobacter sp. GP33]
MIPETITLNLISNFLYAFLITEIKPSFYGLMKYFTKKNIVLTELQAKALMHIVENESWKSKADGLDKEDFIEELKGNQSFQNFFQTLNQVTDNHIQMDGDNNSVNTGSGDTLNNNSRKIDTHSYVEDNRTIHNHGGNDETKKL